MAAISSWVVPSVVSPLAIVLSSQPHVITTFFVFLAIAAWFYLQSFGKRLPPSPPALPVIGHLHLLGRLPHQSLYQLSQKYGPVFFIRLGSMPTVVVSSPAMAKEFLHNHDAAFSDRPSLELNKRILYNGQSSAMMEYGARWRGIRKLYTQEILTPKRIEIYKHLRNEEISFALQKIERREGCVVEVRKTLFSISVNIMTRLLFGNKSLEANGKISEFKAMVLELGEIFVLPVIGDLIPYLKWLDLFGYKRRMDHVFKRVDALLEEVVSERLLQRQKQGPVTESKDMLDSLLDYNQKSQPWDTSSVKAVILDLLVAGTETTSTTAEWTMAELLLNPQLMLKLQEELGSVVGAGHQIDESDFPRLTYLHAVIKESFRLHPALPLLLPHLSKHACEVVGYRLPQNTRLLVNVWAMGRDSKVWENPEKFMPERFIGSAIDARGQHYELLPFGTGRRGCPGLHLGMPVVGLVISNLANSFDWSLPPGETASTFDTTESVGASAGLAKPLKAVPTARKERMACKE